MYTYTIYALHAIYIYAFYRDVKHEASVQFQQDDNLKPETVIAGEKQSERCYS